MLLLLPLKQSVSEKNTSILKQFKRQNVTFNLSIHFLRNKNVFNVWVSLRLRETSHQSSLSVRAFVSTLREREAEKQEIPPTT